MASDPTNKNFLGQTGFRLVLDRTPTTNYFSQSASLPGISIGTTNNITPFDQYKSFEAASRNDSNLSDATLSILSSKYNPNLRIKFQRMFPESISDLLFTTTASDIDYLEATITFRYSIYTIERL